MIKYNPNYMSIETTICIKAAFSIFILLHHISQRINKFSILFPFRYLGYLFVGVFFYYSGYGLMKSYLTKDNYLQNFLKNRISKIFFPFLIVNSIYLLYNSLTFNEQFSFLNTIKKLIGIEIIEGSFGWFVVSLIILNCIFYFINKNKNIASKQYIYVLGMLIYLSICILFQKSSTWYNSSFCFLLGIEYARSEGVIISFVEKNYYKVGMIGTILFFCTFSSKFIFNNILIVIILEICSSLVFVFLVIIISYKIDFSNKFLQLVGKISYEVYLVQGLVIIIVQRLTLNEYLFSIISIAFTFISAFVFNKLLYLFDIYK